MNNRKTNQLGIKAQILKPGSTENDSEAMDNRPSLMRSCRM